MSEQPPPSLPPFLDAAARRLASAAARVCERAAESLGLAALSAPQALARDHLQQAQRVLEQGADTLTSDFLSALRDQLTRDCRPRARSGIDAVTSWDALTLVDDQALEMQVAGERLGRIIGQSCEWELRELDSYLLPALQRHLPDNPAGRNPIRPEIVGQAVLKSLDNLRPQRDVRKLLEAELARTWQALLPPAYAGIVSEMRSAGHAPAALAIRQAAGATPAAASTRAGAATSSGEATVRAIGDDPHSTRGRLGPPEVTAAAAGPEGSRSAAWQPTDGSRRASQSLGRIDPDLMALMRRLVAHAPAAQPEGMRPGPGDAAEPMPATLARAGPAAPPANLIRAHRHELMQASARAVDRTVIDVVGSLFEQILSDPAVPAPIAQQIGRLQLPVLRAAIGDNRFFASQQHPVRQLVNRVASLGAALDGLAAQAAEQLVQKVRELVQGIVEGEFDRVSVYEAQLDALERFVADHGREALEAHGGSTRMLADREHEWRTQRRYSRQLHEALREIPAPDFVRDFVGDVWSQVIVRCTHREGVDSPAVRRMRAAGQDLLTSVQPKGTPELRQAFVASLPRLMQDLSQGMDLIAWPEASRKAFFGLLLPAHARALKSDGLSTLDHNLLARQIERLMQKPLPAAPDPQAPTSGPMPLDSAATLLSPDEAQAVGLLADDAVDWDGTLDIDLTEEPAVQACDLAIDGLPAPRVLEPTRGSTLADHVRLGFAYQMHLDGQWQKVRLNHISPARSFFVFSRGTRHQQVISLTHRMLVRLCETNRFRAFENAYLLERATARARRQLAELRSTVQAS